MQKLLLSTIAAVLLVGCGESQQSAAPPEAKPEPPTAKVPDISIHKAAYDGNIEVVKQHLAAGTDVNEKNLSKFTALHFATSRGNDDIIELLIKAGADINSKNKDGETPRDLSEHEGIADLLGNNGGIYGTLHGAAMNGDIDSIKKLIEGEADVNAKAHAESRTPLHYAALRGDKEIVDLLIQNGAKLNVIDGEGLSVLDMSYISNLIPDHLLRQGAKTAEELKAEGK